METIVVYKSKTGFTKRYAEWIAKELNCKAVPVKEVTSNSLQPYQTIIYGGRIMAGQIVGLKKFKQALSGYPDKKLIVFATGMTSSETYVANDPIRNANFSEEEKNRIPYYYFQGGLNYEKMSLGAKLVMKMVASSAAKKKDQTSEERVKAESMRKSCDYSDRKFIDPLLQYIREEAK
jgi:menaquinone-dependent protoporphyrinogen IX oxidase